MTVETSRIRAAWDGRVSGCLLGKPVEVLSFQQGRAGASIAGMDEVRLADVVERTATVARST